MNELEELRRRVREMEAGEAELRQVAEALRQDVEKYLGLLNESSDPIFSFYPDGRYRHVNQAFAEGVGRKLEEIIGRTIWDVFPKEEADKRYAIVKWVFENGLTRVIEVRVPRPDGDRYYITTVKPILGDQGQVITVLCISKEITERKQAEDKLRQSEERYRTILENIEEGYHEVDLAGNFVFFNESFRKIMGYSREELLGMNFRQYSDGENAQKVKRAYNQVYRTGEPLKRFEWEIIRKDGARRHLAVSVSLINDSSGQPSGFRGIVRDTTDRKEAEEALKRSEIRYRNIFENAVEGIFQSTPEGRYLSVNPALSRMTGYTDPEEMINAITDIEEQTYVHPEDRKRFKEILARDGLVEGFETEHYRKDGRQLWVSIKARAVKDETGRILYYEGSKEDITARKLTEKKHAQLNQLREQLIGPKSLDQKLKIITEGVVTIFSADFARIWITKPGDRCLQCIHSRVTEGPHVCQNRDRCLHLKASSGRYTHLDGEIHCRVPYGCYKIGQVASGLIPSFVTNEVTKDSRVHNPDWAEGLGLVSFAGYRLLSLEGEPVGVLALFSRQVISPDDDALLEGLANSTTQVIQTAKIEASLRESEGRYRTAIEQSNDGFALVKDGLHLYVNQEMCQIFGYANPEEIIGKPIGLVTHPDDRERVIAIHQRRKKGESAPAKYEFKGRRKDGEPVYIEASVSRTIYQGEPVALAYLRDITDRKRAEEEQNNLETRMREVQKLESLGVLAGGIAHDFNNLLMAILGYAELALLALSPASPARSDIEEIVRASQRAADLCRQMLAYSGKGRFVVGRYDLVEIVREMAQMLAVSISKKASLRYALAEDLPAVEVDVTQMRQVIMNLITNASEALGEEDGTISVSCGLRECDRATLSDSYLDDKLPEGKYVYLEVSDTGSGMDAETRQRIFDPFFSTKFTGRGLGLGAVLGIVRGHKGAIKVTSQPGKGTTFVILLPAVEWRPEDRLIKGKQSVPTHREGKILLIDDDINVRQVGSAMLKRLGFQVLTAGDGLEGLEIFQERREEIDCVILDLTMPKMGGEETFFELRRLQADVRVILSSGYDEHELTQRFAGQGLAGFIQKPYTLAGLQKNLNRVLG